MLKTRAELIIRILEILGVLANGQTPSIDDTARVSSNLDSTIEYLGGLEIIYVGNVDAINPQQFEPIAACCADVMKVGFGVTADDAAVLTTSGIGIPPGTGAAAMALRVMARGRPTYEPLRTVNF